MRSARSGVIVCLSAWLLACVSARQSRGIYHGESCESSARVSRVRVIRASTRDSTLGAAGVIVLVRDARTKLGLPSAMVGLVSADDTVGGVTNGEGTARAVPRATGQVQLVVRRIGYKRREDTVRLRLGYLDTVKVELGPQPRCWHVN